jgi:hypothetical protein
VGYFLVESPIVRSGEHGSGDLWRKPLAEMVALAETIEAESKSFCHAQSWREVMVCICPLIEAWHCGRSSCFLHMSTGSN